jgi:enoyl-[acyl-carrier protein] reductase II
MHPDILRLHIQRCKEATTKPFGVNVPLMYPQMNEIMQIITEEHVPIVFTSAGSPKTWTQWLHEHGIIVCHVVSGSTFAKKCEDAGVDAVVAEGFEAGGHNGREETTTLCLIPQVRVTISLPLIAAGGISSRASYNAAFALGAEGVQMGTRFALCTESSAHPAFKDRCRSLKEGDTKLLLRKITPVRLADNDFSRAVTDAENKGASIEELQTILGRGRAKKGIFEGDINEGELEIGQISSMIKKEETVAEIFRDLVG